MSDLDQEAYLVLGTCSHGPFRHSEANLLNPAVRWTSCGYHVSHIETRILEGIQSGVISQGTHVLFATWDIDKDASAEPLRFGEIDYIANHADYVVFTVFLGAIAERTRRLPVRDNPRLLCRYGSLVSETDSQRRRVLSRS